ncbi:complement regulator-acquiring protein [Borreliella garinii]|uniref:complement regulator-acquiring protein n=2 Tax=Borreliella garinii TaxID=29519 RepID=UPI001AF01047|nr:complement regulator-acquiring protein [Borreliella garinii]
MKKTKPDIIKFNILTTVLTLICISCAVDKIDPESKSKTYSKESAKNFLNKSQNFKPSNQKSLDKEDIISKLKAIGKKLEAQEKKDTAKIAKIAAEKFDFLDTFKIGSHDLMIKDNQMQIKRIIYSSLNYEKQKINILKEILEKLKQNPKNTNILGTFMQHISWFIQYQINEHLKLIQDKLYTLTHKEAKDLLISIEYSLELKQRFKKTLNETIEAYNQNLNNIKSDAEALANHMNENYKDHEYLKPID